MKSLTLILSLLLAVPLSAQERPIAGTTLQSTDTSANSLLVGCTVGSTTCTGGIKAGAIAASGVVTVSGVGTHAFSVAGGNTSNAINVRNTSAGTAAQAYISVGTDVTADQGFLAAYSSTFTTSTYKVASGTALVANAAGGLSIAAIDAAGDIRSYTGGTTLRHKIDSGGIHTWYASNGSTAAIVFTPTASSNTLTFNSLSNGTGNVQGNGISIGRNDSGNGAAGWLDLLGKSGTHNYVWTDATGVLRIGSAQPDEDGTPSDTSGTVVGAQVSTRALKNVIDAFTDNTAALDAILHAPIYRFTYKSGAYNNTEFLGIMADESPLFSMDAGRVFNPISAFGYTVGAIKALDARISALEKKQ